MTFDEDFPETSQIISIRTNLIAAYRAGEESYKQRVREAIRKCGGQSDKNEPFQLCWSDELLRELGL